MTMASKMVSLHESENVRSHTTDEKFPSGVRLFVDVTNTEQLGSEIIMATSPFHSQFQPSHIAELKSEGFSRRIIDDEENYEPPRTSKNKIFIDDWQYPGEKENANFKKLVKHSASISRFIGPVEQAGSSTCISAGSLLDSLEEDSVKSECTEGDGVTDLQISASIAESTKSLEETSIDRASETRTNGSDFENEQILGRVIKHISSEDSASYSVETILSCNENEKSLSSLTSDSTITEGDRLYQEALVLMKKIDNLSAASQDKSDRTILAGQRLHFNAKERAEKLETKRKEECALRAKAEMSARNNKHMSVATMDECYERLYNRSIDMQMEGKKRREDIARASRKRNEIPGPEYFGYIPLSRAGDMYEKGMIAVFDREKKISALREEKNREIEANHAFKLADGAFAYSIDLYRSTRQQPSQSAYDCLFSSSRSSSNSSDTTWKTNSLSRKENRIGSYEIDTETNVSITSVSSSALSTSIPKSSKKPTLPLSRSDDMYERSLRQIQARHEKIAHLVKEELKDYGFKLSEGSFSSKIYRH